MRAKPRPRACAPTHSVMFAPVKLRRRRVRGVESADVTDGCQQLHRALDSNSRQLDQERGLLAPWREVALTRGLSVNLFDERFEAVQDGQVVAHPQVLGCWQVQPVPSMSMRRTEYLSSGSQQVVTEQHRSQAIAQLGPLLEQPATMRHQRSQLAHFVRWHPHARQHPRRQQSCQRDLDAACPEVHPRRLCPLHRSGWIRGPRRRHRCGARHGARRGGCPLSLASQGGDQPCRIE